MATGVAGRAVLVTGAGGGIGRAVALRLARCGASVLATDANAAGALKTATLASAERVGSDDEQGSLAARCIGAKLDVTDADDIDSAVALTVKEFGRLDCAVNCAGIEGERAPIHASTLDNWDRVMSVNVRGCYSCMRAEIAQMLSQDADEGEREPAGGAAKIDTRNYSIVNVSSTAGLASMPEFSAYCASKHAMIGLTKTAAKEYAAAGIRVNVICPSTTGTPMVERFSKRWPEWQAKQNASLPVGRIGRADEIAATVVFLLSRDCPMMTGSVLTVDGAASA